MHAAISHHIKLKSAVPEAGIKCREKYLHPTVSSLKAAIFVFFLIRAIVREFDTSLDIRACDLAVSRIKSFVFWKAFP